MKMFYQCDKIIEINLSKFNTSQITDMSNMFAWCGLLSSLDIYLILIHQKLLIWVIYFIGAQI